MSVGLNVTVTVVSEYPLISPFIRKLNYFKKSSKSLI